MAEFLILRQNYWTGREAEAIAKMGDARFNAGVHRPWDIVEVRDDGFFKTKTNSKGHGWNQNAFYLLIVEGTTKQFTEHYTEPLNDKDGNAIYRHRWTMEDLTPAQKLDLASPLADSKLDTAVVDSTVKAKTAPTIEVEVSR